ncbi:MULTISPECIES: hypothetical protein [unclassified Roseitalea]|uniref:4'-phosphopantetheinyl transferase family protein n=1 Tax=unclassified Roseitalea TaxID=2639107 RepID=UPI00273F536D|nr:MULTISPECIES: hypothetical protein [unclassified Roseitalea]
MMGDRAGGQPVTIWIVNVDTAHVPGSPDRQDDRAHLALRSRLITASRLLLSYALVQDGCDHDALEGLWRSGAGKPFLPRGPQFSISHAGTCAAVAISKGGPIGIDLEVRRMARITDAMTSQLRTALSGLMGDDIGARRAACAGAAIDVWVRLEAVVKCLGLTMRDVLAKAESRVLPVGNMTARSAHLRLSVMDIDIDCQYVCAVAIRSTAPEPRVYRVDWSDLECRLPTMAGALDC